jgi:hypothetical protein
VADLEQAAVWHRQIAALVAAADRAGVAPAELPSIRARLGAQVAEFTRLASLAGAPLPALQPTAADIAAVTPALGDLSDTAAAQLVRTALATLDAAETALRGSPATVIQASPGQAVQASPTPSTIAPLPRAGEITQVPPGHAVFIPSPAPGETPIENPGPAAKPAKPKRGIETWRPGARNAAVYGSCALIVFVMQVVLFYSADENALAYQSFFCVLVLPAFNWALGWWLIGFLFEPAAGTTLDRSPRLGVFISAAPLLLACAGFTFLILRNFA